MSCHISATTPSLLVLLIAGCASTPPAPVQVVNAPPASAAPAPLGPTVRPTTNAATLEVARSLGYAPRVHNGTVVYCRKDAALGTRFESTSCISQEQVAAAAMRTTGNQASIADAQRHSLSQPGGDTAGR